MTIIFPLRHKISNYSSRASNSSDVCLVFIIDTKRYLGIVRCVTVFRDKSDIKQFLNRFSVFDKVSDRDTFFYTKAVIVQSIIIVIVIIIEK